MKTFTSLTVKTDLLAQSTGRVDVFLEGAATFVRLPVLAEALEKLPPGLEVHLHIGGLAFIDHACHDVLEGWQAQYAQQGGEVVTEWDALASRRDPGQVYQTKGGSPKRPPHELVNVT